MYRSEDNFEGNEVLRTYVKIVGENVEPIVQKLAKLAVDSPEICVWDYNILNMGWNSQSDNQGIMEPVAEYFGMGADIFEKECDKIIVKSGTDLGDANIYFEWLTPPSDEQIRTLTNRINGIIKPFGNKYTVTNKK